MIEHVAEGYLIETGRPSQCEYAVASEGGRERRLSGNGEKAPPARKPSGSSSAAQERKCNPCFVLGHAGHKPERGVAPAPSDFARQDDQSPEGAVEELRVAASFLALRSADGGTIHIGGACGGITPRGKSANHSCVATQSEPLRMDAIRDEVQLTLIRGVGQRNLVSRSSCL